MAGMSRREEIRSIHKKYRFFYEMLAGAAVLVLCILVGAGAFGADNIDYRMNLFTEGMGIVATVFIINRWYAQRERDRTLRELRIRLVRDAGSPVNQTALNAIEELRANNWISGEGSVLKDESLQSADLTNAMLWGADLKGAKIDGAILTGARLVEAELQNARLERALLHKTWMHGADLTNAKMDCINAIQCAFERSKLQHVSAIFSDMRESSFSDADMRYAVLAGTDFRGANLNSARLEDANLNNTVLSHTTWIFTNARNARLRMANLQHAEILSSDLEGTDLAESDLRNAKIWGSWMVSVNLSAANLQEADLRASFLENANLTDSNLLGAILPDGTQFTEATDMNRFTDTNHSEYLSTIAAINEQRVQLQLDD